MSPTIAPAPIHVSERFRLTLEATILDLEAGAARDERLLPFIKDKDHLRRHRLLVAAQLERAFRLRELLSRTSIGPGRAA
jgi:hypothetical protein